MSKRTKAYWIAIAVTFASALVINLVTQHWNTAAWVMIAGIWAFNSYQSDLRAERQEQAADYLSAAVWAMARGRADVTLDGRNLDVQLKGDE